MAEAEKPLGSSPEQEREAADSLLEQTTNALSALKKSITNNASKEVLNRGIDSATSAINNAKEYATQASVDIQEKFETELNLLDGTLEALPDEIKKDANKKIETLREAKRTIFEKLKSTAKTGFEKVVDTLATTAETVGNFMNKMWDSLKPHLARIAETPGIAFLLGEKKLSALQGWLGYDADSMLMQQQFRDRLPDDVSFTIANKKEAIALNDRYKKMLEKKGKKETEYPKEQFIADCIQGAKEQNILPIEKAGKKEYQMAQFVEAAKVLIEKEPQGTPTPATTPTPSTSAPAPK